jgi:hypothetical protein
MKTNKIFLLVFSFALLLSPVLEAQNRVFTGPLRQRIMEVKLREISKALNLDQETTNRLRPVYASYENELAGIHLRDTNGFNEINSDSLSSEEAEKLITVQISNARKILDLREKYYARFKTVLTPQQIIRLYQTETAIRRKVIMELRRRFGGLGGQKQ